MSDPAVVSAMDDDTSTDKTSTVVVDSHGTRDDRQGRISQRQPSRLSRSKSRDRKGRLSSSNSGLTPSQTKPPRSTRRVTAAQKKWGNSSLPSISVLGSSPGRGQVCKAEREDRGSIVQGGWKETHGAQRNQGLLMTDEESEGGSVEPPEDDDILSDQDEELTKSFSSLALRRGEVEEAENRHSRPRSSSRRRTGASSRRSLHGDEGVSGSTRASTSTRSKRRSREESDTKDPSSQHARSRSMSTRSNGRSASTRRRPSDRSQRDIEDENASGGSTKSSRRRTSRRDETDSKVKDPSSQRARSQSQSQSNRSKGRSASTRRRPIDRSQRDKEDDNASVGSTKSSQRRSSRRDESGDDRSSSTKLHSSVLRRQSSDDDDRSVRSISRRHRQQGSRRTTKASSSHVAASVSTTSISSERFVEQEKDRDQAFALAKHLRSNPKEGGDEDKQAEESSCDSTNCEHPTALLQFDPANANHFTLVRQDSKAVVKCETFKHPDGTESELRIREFKKQNLPTFASPPEDFQESGHSSAVIDYASDDEVHGRGKRSMSNLASMMTPNLGRRGVNESGLRRGVTKSISTDSALRHSIGRKDRDHKNQPASPWASASLQNSVKDFMGRWNKSGETPSIDENLDESMRAGGWFHQVHDNSCRELDDDCD